MTARCGPTNETQELLLTWVARHGVATAAHLGIRFGIDERVVSGALAECVARGLLRRAGVLVAEPELFVATAKGLRTLGLAQMGVCHASPRAEGHLRAAAWAAVWLERRLGLACDVLSERELQLAARGSLPDGPSLARPYVHHRGGARKRPDLLIKPVSPAEGLPVAVEVELSRKSAAHLEAICRAWQHCAEVAGVLYLAAPTLVDALGAAIERADATRRITVLALADPDVPTLRRRSFYRSLPLMRGAITESAGADRGTPREIRALLRWVGRWGVAGVDSIGVHMGLDQTRVCSLVSHAQRAALVGSATILREEGPLCWATASGLRAADLRSLPACAVNYSSAARGAAEARVAASLEREYPAYRVLSRRELKASAALRGAREQVGAPRGGPSLVLVPAGDERSPSIAVFVQSGPQGGPGLAVAANAWTCLEDLASALVYVSSASASLAAARRLASIGASDRVRVRLLPKAFSRRA